MQVPQNSTGQQSADQVNHNLSSCTIIFAITLRIGVLLDFNLHVGFATNVYSVRSFLMEAMKKFSELKKSELAVSGEASQAASQQVGSL